MTSRVAIIGAGGFGREALDVLRAMDPSEEHWQFSGFVAKDEPDPAILHRIDAHWLGSDAAFLADPQASHFVLAISGPKLRQRVAERYEASGLSPLTLLHPTATIGRDVEFGDGAVVCAHVSITTNVRIGRHAHIDRVVTVGHDCRLGDFVTLHPAAVLSGAVIVGAGARFGTNSCVLPGLSIGRDATVGAGAVVTADVADGLTVVGVPARALPASD